VSDAFRSMSHSSQIHSTPVPAFEARRSDRIRGISPCRGAIRRIRRAPQLVGSSMSVFTESLIHLDYATATLAWVFSPVLRPADFRPQLRTHSRRCVRISNEDLASAGSISEISSGSTHLRCRRQARDSVGGVDIGPNIGAHSYLALLRKDT